MSHATSFVVHRTLCQDGEVRSRSKRWGGRTGAERRAERRQQLIEAATEIWSESGWAAVTMRGVCARTSLNDRYFYEDFKPRDELLVAAWDGVRDAKTFGTACWQRPRDPSSIYTRGDIDRSEDCLYLNVFAPTFAPDDVPKTWSHGPW